MKYKRNILIILTFLIALLLPVMLWFFKTPEVIDIVILDKTVPNTSFREHKALTWILGNQKITKSDNQFYDESHDYFGYFPNEDNINKVYDLKIQETPPDLIYIADTYGVYENDFTHSESVSQDSKLIYGGLTLEEVEIIRKSAYKGTTVVAEFNSFASPTNDSVRNQMYDLMGLRWTGWISRYFNNLSSNLEVPEWIIGNYEEQNKSNWTFSDYGMIFVGPNGEIVVLGKDAIEKQGVRFNWTKKGEAFLGKKDKTNYDYWFDIVVPDKGSHVLANYDLALKSSGKAQLKANGIPLNFPAVITSNTGLYKTYYFAGDYADHPSIPNFYKIRGLTKFMEKFLLNENDRFFWKSYIPLMKEILMEAQEPIEKRQFGEEFELPKTIDTEVVEGIQMISKTNKRSIQIYKNNTWEDFFVKGVNIGIALPGKWFTNFPNEESIYMEWFEDIGAMNANTIRVYTLMHPAFYRALLRYNVKNPKKKLWLLQEIWPEEEPENNDYLADSYVKKFNQEIEYVVDAIHGNLSIPERQGRAYGDYDVDISKYILGFLVGRELEPEEVISTNERNSTIDSFRGKYIDISKSSPTEIWLGKSMDHLMNYQEEYYKWQHPVAIVSWPTLDVINHDVEWNFSDNKDLEYNDKVSIDIRNFDLGEDMKAGIFGAYHIYPNYPDFMNNTVNYSEYKDKEGQFRYGGYLQEFMDYHKKYPALVAEFGIATGLASAHDNPDGYHHGGLSEKEQGEGIVRMITAIKKEGYAGGVVFEWMDEWAKKTWITEPFIIPYENNVFWHNVIDPEQNYGIQAMEAMRPQQSQRTIEAMGVIKKLELAGNESYLYINLLSNNKIDLNNKTILIGLDTYDTDKGSFKYNNNIDLTAPSGMEFLISLNNNESNLKVIPEYNIAKFQFSSSKSSDILFEKIEPIINSQRITKDGLIIEEIRGNASQLNKGNWNGYPNHWYQENNITYLRIPWGRLSITDPKTYQVLDDDRIFSNNPSRDTIHTTTTDGLRITVLLINDKNEILQKIPENFDEIPEGFLWNSWNEPSYNKRLKKSYDILKENFETID